MSTENTLSKPKFLEGTQLDRSYYEMPSPYEEHPTCKTNLLELSRYARNNGKKLAELTKEEVEMFS